MTPRLFSLLCILGLSEEECSVAAAMMRPERERKIPGMSLRGENEDFKLLQPVV